ncbi:MAG: ABC transporter permease [Firmicutes bacterium]|nr:ABC transporter permease [Bacillota bacterium]
MEASTVSLKEARREGMRRSWYRFSRSNVAIVGLVGVLLTIVLAIFAPLIAPYPQHASAFVDYENAMVPPSRAYLLGSDPSGRDILSRIIFATRGALKMGIGVLAAVVPLGVVVGLIAGYHSGSAIGVIIMRITDIFLAVPPLLLALAVSAVLKPNLFNAMMAVSISWWPWYTRLVYSMVCSIKNEFYTQAAELTGASKSHIMFREILPNCLPPILTKMTLDIGFVILLGASLSFVGLGEQPPTPALGTMVADGAKYMPQQWWVAVFPGLAIMFIVLCFNLLGDGVRDTLSTEEV